MKKLSRLAFVFALIAGALAAPPHDPIQQAARAEQAKEWDEAIRLYELVLQKSPRHPVALAAMGNCWGEKGEWGRAVFLLEKARALEPRRAETYLLLGRGYRVLGWNERARETWRRGLVADPRHIGLHEALESTGLE